MRDRNGVRGAAGEGRQCKLCELADEEDDDERHAESHPTVLKERDGSLAIEAGTNSAETRKNKPMKNAALTEKKLLRTAAFSESEMGQSPPVCPPAPGPYA